MNNFKRNTHRARCVVYIGRRRNFSAGVVYLDSLLRTCHGSNIINSSVHLPSSIMWVLKLYTTTLLTTSSLSAILHHGRGASNQGINPVFMGCSTRTTAPQCGSSTLHTTSASSPIVLIAQAGRHDPWPGIFASSPIISDPRMSVVFDFV